MFVHRDREDDQRPTEEIRRDKDLLGIDGAVTQLKRANDKVDALTAVNGPVSRGITALEKVSAVVEQAPTNATWFGVGAVTGGSGCTVLTLLLIAFLRVVAGWFNQKREDRNNAR